MLILQIWLRHGDRISPSFLFLSLPSSSVFFSARPPVLPSISTAPPSTNLNSSTPVLSPQLSTHAPSCLLNSSILLFLLSLLRWTSMQPAGDIFLRTDIDFIDCFFLLRSFISLSLYPIQPASLPSIHPLHSSIHSSIYPYMHPSIHSSTYLINSLLHIGIATEEARVALTPVSLPLDIFLNPCNS